MVKKILVISICLFMVGCATPTVNLYRDDFNFPPTDSENVRVFRGTPMVSKDKAFIEIGEVTVSNPFWCKIEEKLKKKASELGGDAVYIIRQTRRYGKLNVTGVVIKY